jgi:hypothetical protein
MRRFSVWGNCQMGGLAEYLLKNHYFVKEFEHVPIKAVHQMSLEELKYYYEYILPTIDLIIVQPINSTYRDDYRFSTKSVLSTVTSSCIQILVPVVFFKFYHPFQKHIECIQKIHRRSKVPPFTDTRVNLSDENVVFTHRKELEDIDHISTDELEKILKESIIELEKRERKYPDCCTIDTHIITILEFIKKNYKDQLLFHTINHPTKYIFWFITDKVLDILKIQKESYPEDFDYMDYYRAPFYASVQKMVNFNLELYPPMNMSRLMTVEEYICLLKV